MRSVLSHPLFEHKAPEARYVLYNSLWGHIYRCVSSVSISSVRNVSSVSKVKSSVRSLTSFCGGATSISESIFIGPESDHCLPLSVTNWLTHSCLVSFIDVTLVCEDANSKLVDVVTVADDDRLGNSLLHIWKLRFGEKAKLLFRLWAQGLVKILKLKFRQDLKLEFGQFFSADVF